MGSSAVETWSAVDTSNNSPAAVATSSILAIMCWRTVHHLHHHWEWGEKTSLEPWLMVLSRFDCCSFVLVTAHFW
jgi:hypothetical protein